MAEEQRITMDMAAAVRLLNAFIALVLENEQLKAMLRQQPAQIPEEDIVEAPGGD